MELALEKGLKSIAFPIISSGAFGHPLKGALQVAISTLKKYEDRDIEITLVLCDIDTYMTALKIMDKK